MRPPLARRPRATRTRSTVPLAPLTTLGLGGLAASVVELTDAAQLEEIAAAVAAGEHDVPIPLGGGSNVLVADEGVARPVLLVRTRGVRSTRTPDGRVLVTAQAGHPWQALLDELVAEGLTGMEFLTGIPGTVGAMPVQNVGAYGQEVRDTLVSVVAWDWRQHRRVVLDAHDCRLGHRTSAFKHRLRWLILEVTFALRPGRLSAPVAYGQVARALGAPLGSRAPLEDAVRAVEEVRATKGMVLARAGADARSAGSVFLSPAVDDDTATRLRARNGSVHTFPDGRTRVSASWLMQVAGYELGEQVTRGVRMSTRQYTLVATRGATTTAFVDATRRVQERVHDATGVLMPPELDVLGSLPGYSSLLDRGPLEVAMS